MGFVKAKITTSSRKTRHADCETLSADLNHPDAGVRRHAAQTIHHCPDAASALGNRLKSEMDVAVRGAILDSMCKIKDADVVDQLVVCLRSDDAALRNEVIEALKYSTTDVSQALDSLLADPDPDLRIFAVNVLESRCDPDVERRLIGVIERDENVNVCSTAIDLLCEMASEAAFGPITRLKDRFASEPYLQFATDLALKRIRRN